MQRFGEAFLYYSVTKVEIIGLKFVGCGENTVQFVRKLTIVESMFIGTTISGTSLVLDRTEAQIKDSQFQKNTIGRNYYYYVSTNISGYKLYTEEIHINVSGAIFVTHGNVTLVRCTFDGNKAEYGAALFIKNKRQFNI